MPEQQQQPLTELLAQRRKLQKELKANEKKIDKLHRTVRAAFEKHNKALTKHLKTTMKQQKDEAKKLTSSPSTPMRSTGRSTEQSTCLTGQTTEQNAPIFPFAR